jgi:hypothetical protein
VHAGIGAGEQAGTAGVQLAHDLLEDRELIARE